MELLIDQLVIWAPSVFAVLAIVFSALKCMNNVSKTCNDFKEANFARRIEGRIDEITKENLRLKKQLNELLDNQKRINGYGERKYGTDKDNKQN